MKNIAFLSVMLVLAACGGDPKEPPKTEANVPPSGPTAISSANAPASGGSKVYPQATKTIEARIGETFEVALPGNVSTPYEWRYDDSPNPSVTMSGHNYTDAPPASCQGCDGYKGTFHFTFTAKAEGPAKLHFSYARAMPPGSPAEKEMTVDVRVTK